MIRKVRLAVVVGAMFCLLLPLACGKETGKSGKKEYLFHGKVEKVDAGAKTIAVHNDNIPGWMMSMTMTYAVDKPDMVNSLKPGDQITAKVYEGDVKTLYEVKVVPPASDENSAPGK